MIRRRAYAHILEQAPAHNRWLTTFNDLITLLMVFFVLLFSMGHMDAERFSSFQNGMQSAMGVLNAGRFGDEGPMGDAASSFQAESETAGQPLEGLPETTGLEAEYTPKGIKLTLNDGLLFDSGSADITGKGVELLETVGRVIKPARRHVRVEGHTDDRSISNTRYPSNWELSTARAVNVVKLLVDSTGIDPTLLSAAGYGSFKPKTANDTEAGRAVNRRVEIILGREALEGPETEEKS